MTFAVFREEQSLNVVIETSKAMADQEIRWKQRFNNYLKALNKLDRAAAKIKSGSIYGDVPKSEVSFLNHIIKEGLIQRFEYTHELAWNVMKDYLMEVGGIKTLGSKDATKAAFSADLIANGEVWMEMIKSRNLTTHTYNEKTADEIYRKIIGEYHPEFLAFRDMMNGLLSAR